jgi:hypothetical protein
MTKNQWTEKLELCGERSIAKNNEKVKGNKPRITLKIRG